MSTLAELYTRLRAENLLLVFNECRPSTTKAKALDFFLTALAALQRGQDKIPSVN